MHAQLVDRAIYRRRAPAIDGPNEPNGRTIADKSDGGKFAEPPVMCTGDGESPRMQIAQLTTSCQDLGPPDVCVQRRCSNAGNGIGSITLSALNIRCSSINWNTNHIKTTPFWIGTLLGRRHKSLETIQLRVIPKGAEDIYSS